MRSGTAFSQFLRSFMYLLLSVAWSYGVQQLDFCCSGIPVMLFYTLRFSRCHNTFQSSPHLRLIIGLIRDLFVPNVDSLMG